MGQSSSSSSSSIGGIQSRRDSSSFNHRMMIRRSSIKSSAIISPVETEEDDDLADVDDSVADAHDLVLVIDDEEQEQEEEEGNEYISDLPDECLALIFQLLGSADRKKCSLVCHRWLIIEGQSRNRLSIDARSDLLPSIPSLFTRFDSVTKLALKCNRRFESIGDDALILISFRCPNLTRLKLRACRQLTDVGMSTFAKNCKSLKKLSCGSCNFGGKGINAVLNQCSGLEELSVKRLRGDGVAAEPIGPGVAAASLKTICLKDLYDGQSFGPLIVGSKNLKTLKLFRCPGDWDKLLESIADRVTGLVEVHLERLQISDNGLAAISNCLDLEILHLVKTPECTNAALVSVADRCKLLRKLHIDGWKTNRIGDEGLIAIAKHCPKLQELVLIGVNPTSPSLGLLGANCPNLERLALCGSESIGDAEISCIATKFGALRKLCIKDCPISDNGIEALGGGCPNLVKVKIKKCKDVTSEGAEWFRATRGTVTINLDLPATEQVDASTSDGGAQENVGELNPIFSQNTAASDTASSSNGRSAMSKARLGIFAGRNFVACTFGRWSNSNNSSNSN